MRLAAAVAALFGLALVAQPVLANEEAYAFIEKVYATYEEGDGHGIPLEGPTLRDHFTDELATLIENDAKLGEQKRMNYDPLADAEEWEISDINITIRELTYDHVLASVNFYSYIEARLVNVDLVRTRNGWRIDDIQVPDGRLRQLFTDDPEADDEEVATDGGPVTTESVSESRAAAITEPATPPVRFSGKAVPQPRPAPVRAEPESPAVSPAALEMTPAAPAEPAGDIPAALETAAAPVDAPSASSPASPVETPAEPVVPEASAPVDTPAQPAAMPGGPAPEPAKPVEAAPAPAEPAAAPAVVGPEPRKAAKPPEKEKPRKKVVAPRKVKPKQTAKPKAPPAAAPPSPPPAAEKPPVPPASGAPRFSVTRVPPPPAAKPAKPPVQAATEKAAPKAGPNRTQRTSLP